MQTFLFTDIEGSTRLWERHPQAMGAAIAQHERILREAIGVRGGAVFNTAGDSVCAVFPTTDRAVAAAIDAQRHLLAEPWDTYAPELTLSVRMALDAGDAEASGGNFVGPVLNRLHRLMKTGHGGQILCTAAIAPDDLGPDLRLRDLGRHPLRDIAGELQLYQLVAPGLPVAFPPLVSELPLSRRLPLPLPPATLFGREAVLAEIDGLLRERTARLVTLLGPGGVGKTSLALALGRQLVDIFPDDVHFVDLSALRDGALVAPAIAGVLEIEDRLQSPEDALISRLQQRSLLLILDNCEQIADAAADIVRRLVEETESVTLLITSRVPLRLQGEREVHIEPLPIPASHEDPATNPAVQLFSEQARRVNNRFTLNETAQPAVVEICRLLDGLPLAIELAAAWIRVLDPATLQNRLAEGAPLLKSDTRDRPERHRTLTSTIDWSYQLLSPEAQWAFGRLAVFQGGIPFDGAISVLQEDNRFDFIASLVLIDTLVQANLLQTPLQTSDGPRYTMLQTIQEFGLEVGTPEERVAHHQAHTGYFATMSASAQAELRSPDASLWLDRLDANMENLRAALYWLSAPERPDGTPALVMAMSLDDFFDIRNHVQDARYLLSLAFDAAPDAPIPLRAQAMAQLGSTWLSNYEQAEICFRRSLEIAATNPDDDWQMAAALGLQTVALMRGDFETALEMAQDVIARMRAANDPAALAQALLVLGHTLRWSGHYAEALSPLGESLALSEQLGDGYGVAWARRTQALALFSLGQFARSQALFLKAIMEFERVGDHVMIAFCQMDLALMELRTNEVAAIELISQAMEVLLPVADVFCPSFALDIGAALLVRMDDPSGALELLAAADRWRISTGTTLPDGMQQEAEVTLAQATHMLDYTTALAARRRGESRSLRDALIDMQERIQTLQIAKFQSRQATVA